MSKIIPSTKLKVISGHKLNDMACWRYYHWRWIQNLEPKRLNLNLWYGAVCERQCLSYGACPFITLCQYPSRWKAYAKLYRQREMLYEAEKKELER